LRQTVVFLSLHNKDHTHTGDFLRLKVDSHYAKWVVYMTHVVLFDVTSIIDICRSVKRSQWKITATPTDPMNLIMME